MNGFIHKKLLANLGGHTYLPIIQYLLFMCRFPSELLLASPCVSCFHAFILSSSFICFRRVTFGTTAEIFLTECHFCQPYCSIEAWQFQNVIQPK